MMAKYYIYRNLHREGEFSIKHRGEVIDYSYSMYAEDVDFVVHLSGKLLARRNKCRNVHAFAVTEEEPTIAKWRKHPGMGWWNEITYNPFVDDTFIWKETGEEITDTVDEVWFENGKVYGRM